MNLSICIQNLQGGLAPGGFNFDAKLSVPPELSLLLNCSFFFPSKHARMFVLLLFMGAFGCEGNQCCFDWIVVTFDALDTPRQLSGCGEINIVI